AAGVTLTVSNGVLTNAATGIIAVDAGGGGPRTINASIDNQGTLQVDWPLALTGASESNSGRILVHQDLTVSASSLANTGTIDLAPGHVLTVGGSYAQGGSGVLTFELGGAGSGSELVVNGAATLGGTINIVLDNGYHPKPADHFTIVSANSIGGSFT